MHSKLILIGASGHGKVCLDIAVRMNVWSSIFFLDDNVNLKSVNSTKIIGIVSDFKEYLEEYDFFVAIGNNKIREQIFDKLDEMNANIVNLAHPESTVAHDVKIGVGTVIIGGAIVNPSTTIGVGGIINTGSTIGHDCNLGRFVHVAPGVNIAGNTIIGNRTWLGIGSTIINNIVITDDCFIGAGGLVINDLIEEGVYIGSPVSKKKN